MQLSKIIDPRFNESLKLLMSVKFPIATTLKVKQVILDIRREFTLYEQSKKDLIQKHGNKKPDGSLDIDQDGKVEFAGAAADAFMASINAILKQEVEINKVPISELANLSISVEQLSLLEDIIDLSA